MQFFWQISGPDSHIFRSWQGGKHNNGNAAISSQVFGALSMPQAKAGLAPSGIDLILGIEESGASHILLPLKESTLRLNWRNNAKPYPASRYASLSPIHIDTDIRLQILLDDRQKVSKATKTGKEKGDNSKANGRFWNGPPNTARAAFEHGRCFWRILRNELAPQTYGLPDAPWRRSIQIFSLALNFWTPGGTKPTDRLIDAGLTQFLPHPDGLQEKPENQTWYFRAEDNQGLQNTVEARSGVVPDTWNTFTIPQAEICTRIQTIIDTHSRPKADPPAPLVLLVHDYTMVKDTLEVLGITCLRWKFDIKQLLGFDLFARDHPRHVTEDLRFGSSSRTRSRSPTRASSFSRDTRSPSPTRDYASVYVIDVVDMFKTVTGCGDHPRNIRPATIFNKITCRSFHDDWSAGIDSSYTMQSWLTMIQGSSIDEQNAFYSQSEASWPTHPDTVPEQTSSEAPGLFQKQPEYTDLFNDGSDDEY